MNQVYKKLHAEDEVSFRLKKKFVISTVNGTKIILIILSKVYLTKNFDFATIVFQIKMIGLTYVLFICKG